MTVKRIFVRLMYASFLVAMNLNTLTSLAGIFGGRQELTAQWAVIVASSNLSYVAPLVLRRLGQYRWAAQKRMENEHD